MSHLSATAVVNGHSITVSGSREAHVALFARHGHNASTKAAEAVSTMFGSQDTTQAQVTYSGGYVAFLLDSPCFL